MPTRIKIVGVQFAANPEHKKGTPMTAEEQQRTIDFLTTLDRKRPRVSVKPEPSNEYDKDAFVVRFLSKKVGYVRDSDDYKAKAHAALEASGKGYFNARVVEVLVADNGYFEVEVDMEGTPLVPILHEDRWSMWNPGWPLFPMTEEMLCVEDAICMVFDEDNNDDELREYADVLTTNARHALWRDAKEGLERIVRMLEAREGYEMRHAALDIEHLLSGMCNDRRLSERRVEWLPETLSSPEAETAWVSWLHLKQADTRELELIEMTLWLGEVETTLANIPALAPCATDDDTMLISRAYYTLIPLDKLRQLMTGLVVRKRLRKRLGLPSASLAPAPLLMAETENHFIATIIEYCDSLTKVEQVETMRDFIYAHTDYLPPEVKHRVDHLTDRFLPKDNTEVIRQTAEAMKELASRSTIQNLVYPQADSTTNVGCDQKQSEFKTFLPAGTSALQMEKKEER